MLTHILSTLVSAAVFTGAGLTCAGEVGEAAQARVTGQKINIAFDPETNSARITASMDIEGDGPLTVRLTDDATVTSTEAGMSAVMPSIDPVPDEPWQTITFPAPKGGPALRIHYTATFDDDPAAGEQVGQIHNFSVDAHVSEAGIFLSEGANWFPVWIDPATGHPALMSFAVDIEPIEGWYIVASGNPADQNAAPDAPCWSWEMPRPIDGISLVGGTHLVQSIPFESKVGPDFDIVMQVSPANGGMCSVFLEEAARYLALYEDRLGPFPFERFTIVENFFSSGFAYPGFTLLGPRVIPMGKRALMPGYLDHEILHNWWGNGVYVDPDDGNWCEALATYGANYSRRIFDHGEDAGLEYRRGTLSKLAADADTLDNGPLGEFGLNHDIDRFVGYDKGSFVFIMLETLLGRDENDMLNPDQGRERAWRVLAEFAESNMGKRANWSDIEIAFEEEFGESLDEFFDVWVRKHTVPRFGDATASTVVSALEEQVAPHQTVEHHGAIDDQGPWLLVDPEYRIYRVVPIDDIVPTVSATLGKEGTHFIAGDGVPNASVSGFLARFENNPDGKHTFLIGRAATSQYVTKLSRAENPLTFDDSSFTVAGERFDSAETAILHTVHDPDHPDRFITVFLSNGEVGWNRLPYAPYYSRNSTVVWEGAAPVHRETFQPDVRWRYDQ